MNSYIIRWQVNETKPFALISFYSYNKLAWTLTSLITNFNVINNNDFSTKFLAYARKQ